MTACPGPQRPGLLFTHRRLTPTMMTTAPPNTNTATVKRPRIVGVDALRVLCLIAVIFGHTYGAAIEHREFLSMWRMPLFFVLSGYFLTPGKSLRAETNTRFTTLLVPYFWWSVICSVVTVIWWYHDPKHLTELLIMGWYGGVDQTIIWMAFWFLSVLTATVLLYRCLQHLPAWVPWVVALSGLVLSDILDDELLARTPFSVGLCLPVLFYILCGRALHMLVHTRLQATIGTERPSTPYALIGSGLVVAGFIATALGVPTHSIQSSDFGLFLITPLTGITISAGFILLSATWGDRLIRAIPPMRHWVYQLARAGTVVVLLHGIVLLQLDRWDLGNLHLRFLLTVVICFAVGTLLCRLAPRYRWARLLTGMRTPKTSSPRSSVS
ncbi:acyltransferase family protein [Auritidibacter ignavus]|uniref:acyltransferase family protein n=1 Tax=Auritidibacter ignavus TaxID=678932 RepID=UPI00109CDA07|nr:acyltransferase [Auritidibacter ignavus]